MIRSTYFQHIVSNYLNASSFFFHFALIFESHFLQLRINYAHTIRDTYAYAYIRKQTLSYASKRCHTQANAVIRKQTLSYAS
jgi:hypothetical protein